MDTKGQSKGHVAPRSTETRGGLTDFVLEKGIFSNIFEKDIRRVYIYKKAERLAKAIHLVSPAFQNAPALRDRMGHIAVGLVDAAILPPQAARDALSRELLALSSVLSIARTGGMLSAMNAELIGREAQLLLQEVATYEEPRLFLEESPTLAEIAKDVQADRVVRTPVARTPEVSQQRINSTSPNQGDGTVANLGKGQIIKDKNSDRRSAILSILREKGPSYIKDISTIVRDVSEKTIQRELQALIDAGQVTKTGERRWTTYSIS